MLAIITVGICNYFNVTIMKIEFYHVILNDFEKIYQTQSSLDDWGHYDVNYYDLLGRTAYRA